MTDDYDYFMKKRSDLVYLSGPIPNKVFRTGENGQAEEVDRPVRIVHKVIDCAESHEFFKEGKQVSLRITSGGRQEIKAKFYADTRGITTLQIQRYTLETGVPHNISFTFIGEEIGILHNFISNIKYLPDTKKFTRLDDAFVKQIVLTKEQALGLLRDQPGLLEELMRHQITAQDVAVLGHRRSQLEEFGRLLTDDDYFTQRKSKLGQNKRNEDVWQDFFERNTWIFGYGLNYYLNSPLAGEKLEQIVKGNDFTSAGKRVDALLKTQGLISALAFGEIKTHKSSLLKQVSEPYRRECWQVSDEITGGIAQIQRTVQVSLANIRARTEIIDGSGNPTGEHLFLCQPRSFLIIGSLSEFQTPYGINEQKYSSFELFRRNMVAPEIITFDELYARAKFIVESTSKDEEAAR